MKHEHYWIKKKDKKGNIIWRRGRAQGLEGAKGRIGDIVKHINKILKKNKKVRVLEVGCGFGRALLELKKKFGDKIETTGTNYEVEWNQKLTNEYALDQGFSKKDLPKVYTKINAGKKLPFKSNSFDFVFCQATMQYIKDRALFLEDVNRILTKQGIAILELQEFRDDHPPEHKNMIEILDKEKSIDVLKYLKKFKNIKIKKSKGRYWHYIVMNKTNKLNLNLKLIKVVNLEEISPKFWGMKVIYKIKRG